MGRLDVPGFLSRLGVAEAEPPSLAALLRLHRAFVERIPYETIDIQLERPTSVDPFEAAERIIERRRGGYCYHLNGAFAVLLTALGYQVIMHRAGVQNTVDDPAEIGNNHLALTVTGLPADPAATWLVDVGLGDGLYDPLPLRAGSYRQGPFEYRLWPSAAAPGGWRLDHDPRGAFVGMDLDPAPVGMAVFAQQHEFHCTSPKSGFVRLCVVQRRVATGVDILRALTLSRVGAEPTTRTLLETPRDWWTALADVFGLTLDDLSGSDRERLWRKVIGQHEDYVAARSTGGRTSRHG